VLSWLFSNNAEGLQNGSKSRARLVDRKARQIFPKRETTKVRDWDRLGAKDWFSETNKNSLCHSNRLWKPFGGRIKAALARRRWNSFVIISPGILKRLAGHLRGEQNYFFRCLKLISAAIWSS
jgi:hypothetical protein